MFTYDFTAFWAWKEMVLILKYVLKSWKFENCAMYGQNRDKAVKIVDFYWNHSNIKMVTISLFLNCQGAVKSWVKQDSSNFSICILSNLLQAHIGPITKFVFITFKPDFFFLARGELDLVRSHCIVWIGYISFLVGFVHNSFYTCFPCSVCA